MKEKRLWIINHYAVPPTDPGGTRHFDLARRLGDLGWDVTIIASGFRHKTREEESFTGRRWWKEERDQGVRFVWIRTPSYHANNWRRVLNMLAFSWRTVRFSLLRETRRGKSPALILGSSVHLFAVLSAWIACKWLRVPFAMEVRDLWPQTLIDLGEMSRWHPFVVALRILERFLYRRARRIVTLLPGAGSFLIRRGARPESLVWIPNGVDLTSKPSPQAIARKETFTVMYIGAHGRANCLDVVLDVAEEVARRSDRIRFALIGDGPMKHRLMAAATQRRLHNVAFRDPIPKSAVFDTLLEADATIVVLDDSPLYRYGISLNKIYDFMAAGRPIVFIGSSFNDPVAESGGGISLSCRTPERIAEAIVELAKSSAEDLNAYGDKGRRYVERQHSMEKLAARLQDEVLLPLLRSTR